jgi:hypothetical protein
MVGVEKGQKQKGLVNPLKRLVAILHGRMVGVEKGQK